MNVLLFQLDGKLPNLALMRLAAHHRRRGDYVELRRAGNFAALEPRMDDGQWHRVYASLIFERTRPLAERLCQVWRLTDPIVGGTGWDVARSLEFLGITDTTVDYRDYPGFTTSIGFTQRGCRLKCPFCVVPRKEGSVREERTVYDIWRGDPWPRDILLLDNDFFGQEHWRERIEELRRGRFKVSFNQGVNARMLTAETAAAIASVDYRADNMRDRRIYTAWDNAKDERRLFRGLELLEANGVAPDDIMVYMLIGYWSGESADDREYRRRRLRDFGARPYPMPFVRTPELVGFQRWVIGAYDKRIPWADWQAAGYRPERLGAKAQTELWGMQ